MNAEASMGYKIRVTAGIFIAFLFIPVADHFIFGQTGAARSILYSRFCGVGCSAAAVLLCQNGLRVTALFCGHPKNMAFGFTRLPLVRFTCWR